MLLAEVLDVGTDRLEDPQAEQAQEANEGEVAGLGDSWAAVSTASNCRCVSPRDGDSGGTVGDAEPLAAVVGWAARRAGVGLLTVSVLMSG